MKIVLTVALLLTSFLLIAKATPSAAAATTTTTTTNQRQSTGLPFPALRQVTKGDEPAATVNDTLLLVDIANPKPTTAQASPTDTMDTISTILMVYVFPVQLIVGVLGNALNLMVLLSQGMRTKTNILLAQMALADICLLIFMIPHSMVFNSALIRKRWIGWYMLYLNTHVTGIANMCSVASAWFIVMVTMERLMVIMWPLKARGFWSTSRLTIVIILVWLLSFAVAFHNHICYEVVVWRNITINETVNATVVERTRQQKRVIVSPKLVNYYHLAVVANILIAVLIPLIILVIVNGMLVVCLKRQQHLMAGSNNTAVGNGHSNPKTHQRAQRKVTIMVVVIVTSFTITQLPSAAVYCWQLMIMIKKQMMTQLFLTSAVVSNSCVITGKVANFFLFCMSSANFRGRIIKLIARKLPRLYKTMNQLAPNYFEIPQDAKSRSMYSTAVTNMVVNRSKQNTPQTLPHKRFLGDTGHRESDNTLLDHRGGALTKNLKKISLQPNQVRELNANLDNRTPLLPSGQKANKKAKDDIEMKENPSKRQRSRSFSEK